MVHQHQNPKIPPANKKMSVPEVRAMLGPVSLQYSDDELKKIIDILFGLAYITYEIYRQELPPKR